MQIIPVLDLLNGVVVHAKKGQRAHYLPIASALTTSSQPTDIVKAFLAVYPFSTLYIADLNAIQKTNQHQPHHFEIIKTIQENFPTLEIWLDAGIRKMADLAPWEALNIRHVIGTENIHQLQDFLDLRQKLAEKMILSLDFMPQGYQGPNELLSPAHWPQSVIVMTLNQVGSNKGVDIETLQSVLKKSGQHQHIYAAGGVRNIEDIATLQQHGAHGALVASAIHSNQLKYADIAKLMS